MRDLNREIEISRSFKLVLLLAPEVGLGKDKIILNCVKTKKPKDA